MSIWSWARDLFRLYPPPFMARPGKDPGSIVRLGWRVRQVDVYMADDSVEAEGAVEFWNALVGRRFLAPPVPAIQDVLRAFADPVLRKNMQGILVRVDQGDEDHGSTREEYDERTGETLNAVVTLPGRSRRLLDVAKHEFGHGLGLAHGPEGTLMAPHLSDGPNPLADYQLRAVRDMVARCQ